MLYRLTNIFLVFLLVTTASVAMEPQSAPRPDSTDQLEDAPDNVEAYSPKRKSNGEFIIGWMTGSTIYEQGEGFPDAVASRSFLQFGWGGSIPITELGRLSTLSLKASGLLGLSVSTSDDNPDFQVDLSIPVHAVVNYGALRRKAYAWGFGGGLGLNVARRFQYDQFTFSPSLMLEGLYAPKTIYGLRFLLDLFPAALEGTTTYHSWSIQFYIGT